MPDELTLADLAAAVGIPARTIRFYISRGLLAGPAKAGRGAVYTAQHLKTLEEIKSLQAEGRMLSEIAALLGTAQPAATTLPASAWWQHAIDDDILVWSRSDVSPWRAKQIRAAIEDLAHRLAKNKSPRRNQ